MTSEGAQIVQESVPEAGRTPAFIATNGTQQAGGHKQAAPSQREVRHPRYQVALWLTGPAVSEDICHAGAPAPAQASDWPLLE